MSWNVDRRKMYAHVYFDISGNALGMSVYSIGRIPGFSGVLDKDLAEETQSQVAYDAFLKTLGKDEISKEELQLGKAFPYDAMKDRLTKINEIGKRHADNPNANVVVNLDDPMFWFNVQAMSLDEKSRSKADALPEDKKIKIGETIRKQEFEELFDDVQTSEELEQALQKIYVIVSRKTNPRSGAKDFPSSAPPPSFLVSERLNLAYYPGFRGAQYMAKIPKSLDLVHPVKSQNKEEKWHKVLITDTRQYTDGKPLTIFQAEPLDYITEVLARLFFYNLAGAGDRDLHIMDFNRAVIPVESKSHDLLKNLSDSIQKVKTASKIVGTWIDLYDGTTYESEQALLANKKNQNESELEQKIPLAAQVKIQKIARLFLNKGRLDIYRKLKGLINK